MRRLTGICLAILLYNEIIIGSEGHTIVRNDCIVCQGITKISFTENSSKEKTNHLVGHFLFLLRCYNDSSTGRLISFRKSCLNPLKPSITSRRPFFKNPSRKQNVIDGNLGQWSSSFFELPNQWFREVSVFIKNFFAKSRREEKKCLQCGKHNRFTPIMLQGVSSLEQFLFVVLGPSTKRNIKGNVCQNMLLTKSSDGLIMKKDNTQKVNNTKVYETNPIIDSGGNVQPIILNMSRNRVKVKPVFTSVEHNWLNFFVLRSKGKCDLHSEMQRFDEYAERDDRDSGMGENKRREVPETWLSSLYNIFGSKENNLEAKDSSLEVGKTEKEIDEEHVKTVKELNWWHLMALFSKQTSPRKLKMNIKDHERWYNWFTTILKPNKSPWSVISADNKTEIVEIRHSSESWKSWFILLLKLRSNNPNYHQSTNKSKILLDDTALDSIENREANAKKDIQSWYKRMQRIFKLKTSNTKINQSKTISNSKASGKLNLYSIWFSKFQNLLKLKSPNRSFRGKNIEKNKTLIKLDDNWYRWFMSTMRLRTTVPKSMIDDNFEVSSDEFLSNSVNATDAPSAKFVITENIYDRNNFKRVENEDATEIPNQDLILNGFDKPEVSIMSGINDMLLAKKVVPSSLPKRLINRWKQRKYGGEARNSFMLYIVYSYMVLFMRKILSLNTKSHESLPKASTAPLVIPPKKQFEMEWIVAIAEISPYPHVDPNIIF